MGSSIYPYKILFVEDEKATRKNYVEYLKMFFSEVYEAEDGEEAYKLYKKHKPHILILDINIPKLNGIDLLKKIRETDHTVKAIMLTAYESIDLLQETIGLKLTKYLVKPVSRQNLKDSLNLALSELDNFKVIPKRKILFGENCSWDLDAQELMKEHQLINLTKKEKQLFALLISNTNKTFSVDEIIYEVWDNYSEGNDNALKTVIKNLRKKLPGDTIKNVFGVGYKVEV